MRKSFLLVLTMVFAVAAASLHSASATTKGAAQASTTGVTKTTIKLGATCPLTGPAASYGSICRGMDVYYRYVNVRKGKDGKRGVYGRQIVWKFYDDGYNPAMTVQQTNKLVLEDKVFAVVGSVGTEHNLAVRPFLNDRKVPQTLVSTGASYWGLEYKKWPWTGRLAARLRLRGPGLRQVDRQERAEREDRDLLPERRLREGLPGRASSPGLGAKKSLIVSKEHYEATDTSYASQIARQKIAGADTWVLLTTPVPDSPRDRHREGARLEAGRDRDQLGRGDRLRHACGRANAEGPPMSTAYQHGLSEVHDRIEVPERPPR